MEDFKNLLFDVEKVNFEDYFNMPANSDYSHAIIGDINGQKTVLNVCSERYELVKNSEIFPEIENILNASGLNYSKKYQMVNNARFYADFHINENPVKVGGNPNDLIFPQITVRHSYNGLSKYAIIFGYYRLICSNGLTIPVQEKKEFNLDIEGKHTVNITHSFNTLKERLELFVNTDLTKKMANTYNQMYDRYVENWGDRVIEVMNVAKIGTTKNNIDFIENTIKDESAKLTGGKVNDWLIYNGINELVFNDTLNKKVHEQRVSTDQKILSALLA